MTAPFADTSDLEDMWRPLQPSEQQRAVNLLVKASALLRQATRQTIDDRIALFTTNPTDPRAIDPIVVATVTATIVKRFISNVQGAVSQSKTTGPHSVTQSYALRGDKNDVRGQMIVTDEDIAALTPEAPPQIGNIRLGRSRLFEVGGRPGESQCGVWASEDVTYPFGVFA